MAGRLVFTAVSLMLAFAAMAPAAQATDCVPATVTAAAEADSWIDQNSDFANKGADAVLDVSGTSRALVRFTLPSGIPPGCVVESARLRLFADSATEGTRVEVSRLAFGWSERLVTWRSQPPTVGSGTTAWSAEGYVQWNVTSQVQAMLEGVNHGFLVRDAAEGTELAGGHGFYSREKGENPPELVIRFAAPPSGDPAPPAPPAPAAVTCGQVLTASVRVTNDLTDCPGDGLVIGAPRIIVDLDGHTIDGVGLGTGVHNDGHTWVTVQNGTVQEFDYGVRLLAETTRNAVERLSLRRNEVAGVELFDAGDLVAGNEVRASTVADNGVGVAMLSGTTATVVADNVLTLNNGAALLVRDSDGNRLERNTVSGGGDLGVGLERAGRNVLEDNTVDGTSDGGIQIVDGSHDNRVEGNHVSESGDTGILVAESDGNELISNTSELMSDSGITLNSANDGVVAGNDLGSNPGGLEMDGSSRNRIERNHASGTTGTGIEVLGGSFDNDVVANTANSNSALGIYVSDEAILEAGNRLTGNTANGNGSHGIVLAKGGHTVTGNVARDNGGWGINAGPLTVDGGRNVATGNRESGQCVGVVCVAEVPQDEPPETVMVQPPELDGVNARFSFAGADDRTPPADLRFQCRLDDEEWHDCTSPATYTGLAPGAHVFQARAVDEAGNADPTPAAHSWTIPERPDTTIDAATTTGTTATFTFSSSDGSAVFECALDAAAFVPCSSPRDYSGLEPGNHVFHVRATTTGDVDPTPATHTWTVREPPDTTIDSGPDAETTSTVAVFTFSANDAAATFECSLDGAPFIPCTSPREYTGLAIGAHEFFVRATDAAGNTDPTAATRTWRVVEPPDTTAPQTSVDSGPDAETTSTIAVFTFSANEPATFECSLDGAAFVPCTSPREYSGLAVGAHEFRVLATDVAGNTELTEAARAWRVVEPPDTTAPQTTIDSGPAAETISATAVLTFSADEPGATFECSLDGTAFLPCMSPREYSALARGAHEFRVRATDAAGNTDASPAVRAWRVVEPADTAAPVTSINSGPYGETTSTVAMLRFSASEAGASFECSLDGAAFVPCASPREYNGLPVGDHEFRVRATDAAGNTDATPATRAWRVVEPPDTAAPQTTIDSGPDASTTSTVARFAFSADEPGSMFACSLDGAPFASCSSPAEYSGLTLGRHDLRVRATDAAGNADVTPAGYRWTIVEPPVAGQPHTEPVNGPTESASPPPDRDAPQLVGPTGLRKLVTASSRGTVKLRIGRFDEAVRGVLRLRTFRGRPILLGVKRFTARPGATARVAVRLSKAGRRLLAARKRIKVRATVTAADQLGNSSTKTYRLTLHASRR